MIDIEKEVKEIIGTLRTDMRATEMETLHQKYNFIIDQINCNKDKTYKTLLKNVFLIQSLTMVLIESYSNEENSNEENEAEHTDSFINDPENHYSTIIKDLPVYVFIELITCLIPPEIDIQDTINEVEIANESHN